MNPRFKFCAAVFCGAVCMIATACGGTRINEDRIIPTDTIRHTIMPLPAQVAITDGYFIAGPGMSVIAADKDLAAATILHEYLDGYYGNVTRGDDKARRRIVFVQEEMKDNVADSYTLEVTPEVVTITAADYGGLYYGAVSLLQLLPAEVYEGGAPENTFTAIPCQVVNDKPRMWYRGQHLDVARCFSDKEHVLKFINAMSHHKLNQFHFHLTDDEGWRLEIKSRPELAEIGGFRGGDSPVKHIYGKWGEKYGGYFTQDDIREIIAYAADRNVTVIPEIELPGHSRAVGRVYPHILCDYTPDTLAAGYDMRDVWCVTKEANYPIIEDILREVCELFPSEYIHVGGDEVISTQWRRCPTCSAEIARTSKEQLEGVFMKRIGEILASFGKKQVVWNEVINGGNLPKDVRVSAWEDLRRVKKVIGEGYPTVIMPGHYFYFDQKQSREEPGLIWGGYNDPYKPYSFDFDLLDMPGEDFANVIGFQGAMWTECMLAEDDPEFPFYQCYPRICALSELAWTPSDMRDSASYQNRLMNEHYSRLAAMDLDFRVESPVITMGEGKMVSAYTPVEGADLRYTLDNTPPTADSELYTGPFYAQYPGDVRITTFYKGRHGGPMRVPGTSPSVMKPAVTLTSSLKGTERNPLKAATDYDFWSYTRTTTGCFEGDWFLWTFAQPVDCESIHIRTGYPFLERYVVPVGRVEVSYDGTTFETIMDDFKAKATITPERPVKAVKLTNTYDGNGYDSVFIQDLFIKPKR